MSEYVKLEDAIDAVCGSVIVTDKASAEEVANLLSGIKKRLSGLPTIEVSEDCISRAELLKDMEELNVVSFYELDENSKDAYYELVDAVKGAPSVIPSRPHDTERTDENGIQIFELDGEELVPRTEYELTKQALRYTQAELRASRSRGEWIPCSEKLPEPETEVLVSFSDGTINTLWQKWSLSEGINYPSEPLAYVKDDCIPVTEEEWEEAKIYAVAWMPLPEAYKEA